MRRALPILLGVIAVASLVASLASDPGGPSDPGEPPRDDDGRPAGDESGAVTKSGPEKRREDVLRAIRDYADLVRSSGGAAACRLFPEHFEPWDGKPLEPPAPDVPHPHPAPADGCRSRGETAFTYEPSASWKSSGVERIGKVRFVRGLARATLSIRTAYGEASGGGRTPDVVERDIVWLRPSGSRWRVARPSLLAHRVFESQPGTPRWIFEEPVSGAALSRPADLPRGFGCAGRTLTARDPTGRADRAPAPPSPWVDLSELEMSREGDSLCLGMRTLGPVRPLTVVSIWIEQPKANVFRSVEIRLGSAAAGGPRSRPSATGSGASVSAA